MQGDAGSIETDRNAPHLGHGRQSRMKQFQDALERLQWTYGTAPAKVLRTRCPARLERIRMVWALSRVCGTTSSSRGSARIFDCLQAQWRDMDGYRRRNVNGKLREDRWTRPAEARNDPTADRSWESARDISRESLLRGDGPRLGTALTVELGKPLHVWSAHCDTLLNLAVVPDASRGFRRRRFHSASEIQHG